MRARKLLAFALLVGSTAIVDGTVHANGRADGGKVTICHATDDGRLLPIAVSARAVEAHVAHGDPVIGTDVDDDCEPLPTAPTSPYVQPAGCYAVLEVSTASLNFGLYARTTGRLVDPIAGTPIHADRECSGSESLWGNAALTWAPDQAVAAEQCLAANGDARPAAAVTSTPYMFMCSFG
jgi:hypothetical protein